MLRVFECLIVCICVGNVRVCTHLCTWMYIFVCTRVNTYVCVYVCVCVCVCICMRCIYWHTHTYIYTSIHPSIHRYSESNSVEARKNVLFMPWSRCAHIVHMRTKTLRICMLASLCISQSLRSGLKWTRLLARTILNMDDVHVLCMLAADLWKETSKRLERDVKETWKRRQRDLLNTAQTSWDKASCESWTPCMSDYEWLRHRSICK